MNAMHVSDTAPTGAKPGGTTPASAVDPVCGMTVDPARTHLHTVHEGKEYFFCSESCLRRFRSDPAAFLKPPDSAAERPNRSTASGR